MTPHHVELTHLRVLPSPRAGVAFKMPVGRGEA
jgi:hypothetical protein